MAAHSPSFDELRAEVDDELARFLADRRRALPEARTLVDEIARLVASGGKRIRPAFCYWGFRAGGGKHAGEAVRAAASLELLHTFAIVHDDIMDSSEERRGMPTVHVLRGLDVALLVGDLALVLADALFFGSGFPPGLVAGAFERYSIEQPLAIGARLAGADDALLARLRAFGAPLGEAFQLRDDLLGTFGDRSSVGKPVDSDIREGKRNVPYAKTVAALQGSERDFFVSRWGGGAGLSEREVERLRALVESSGARAQTERLLEELTAVALRALGELGRGAEVNGALAELAHVATFRQT
jgi:geranylgeranyl diphosphate synthase type I